MLYATASTSLEVEFSKWFRLLFVKQQSKCFPSCKIESHQGKPFKKYQLHTVTSKANTRARKKKTFCKVCRISLFFIIKVLLHCAQKDSRTFWFIWILHLMNLWLTWSGKSFMLMRNENWIGCNVCAIANGFVFRAIRQQLSSNLVNALKFDVPITPCVIASVLLFSLGLFLDTKRNSLPNNSEAEHDISLKRALN